MVQHLKDEGTRSQVVLAGAASGLVSRFVIAPLDVVKIRLQLQIHSLSDPLSYRGIRGPTYKGIIYTTKEIFRHEGLTAFWKGNIPAEALYLAYGGLQFFTYRAMNDLLNSQSLPYQPSQSASSFMSGATAGTISTTATYPLDLLRTRFAAQGNRKVYTSLIGGIREIAADEGSKGFFRGLGAANAQILPYMGLFFMSYEFLKQALADKALPFAWLGTNDGLAGVVAAIFSKTAVYPLDTVRKRLQVQGPSRSLYIHRNIPEYQNGVLGTIKTILQREGIRGMYRGLTVALVKAGPTSMVTMWSFERAIKILKWWDEQHPIAT